MKRCAFKILVAWLVLLPKITPAVAQETDHKRIEGTWKIVSISSPAKKKPFVAGMLVRFEDGGVSLLGRKAPPGVTISFRLDPKSTPKQFDIVSKSKLPSGELVVATKGIYEINGDTLRTCAGFPNAERPKTFEVPAGASSIPTTHERLKEPLRQWTDSTGKFSTEASIEFVVDEIVVLRRVDRSIIRIAIARLSQIDQEYAPSWLMKHLSPSDKKP